MKMKSLFARNLLFGLVISIGLYGCDETDPIDPGPDPDPQEMSFKEGARYEFNTYATDAETDEKVALSERTKVWTLAETNVSFEGKSGVAMYLDSIFNLGVVDVVDTVYLDQETNNDIYRHALLIPELDLSVIGITDLVFTSDWRHEAKLGATNANWFVGQVRDTFQYETGIDVIKGFVLTLTDSAVASSEESIMIDGTSYTSTKTTHKLELALTALFEQGPFVVPLQLKSVSLNRYTWTVPSLGVIAREEREGAVIEAEFQGQSIPPIPIPGYVSVMTEVLATGG